MSEPSGRSLGTRYDAAAPPPRGPDEPDGSSSRPSLGAQYSRSRGDESSLDLFSGTVILEPRLVDTRSARVVRQAAGPPRGATRASLRDAPPRPPSAAPTGTPDKTAGDAGVARSSAIMAAGTLVSRTLGFLRAYLLLTALGAVSKGKGANAANIWDTANTLPNMVFLLLAGGVFNAVLIPQLTKALKDPDGGKGYTDRLVTVALLLLGGITAICLIFAYPLYRIYDVTGSPAALHLGWLFGLLCLPQILFYGVYTIFGEVLNSRSRFGAFMWSPALANIASILGLLYFMTRFSPNIAPGDWTGEMILVLGGSTTIGIVAQALVLIIPMRRAGYRFTPNMHFRGVGLRSTGKIAGLAFSAILVQQASLLVTTNVLNNLPGRYPGRIVQSTAFLLFMLPHSLVTVSLITALYTRISTAAHDRDTTRVTDDVATAVRLCGVAVIPVTIGSFALIPPLALLYGHNSGSVAVAGLSSATIAMLLGSFPLALNVIVQRTLYAYEDAVKPLMMQFLGTAVAVPLTLLCALLPPERVGTGVALVQSISYVAQAASGYYWLRKRLGGLPMPGVPRTYGRLAAAAVAGALVTFVVRWGLGHVIHAPVAGALAALVIGGVFFLVVYVMVARALKVREIDALLAPVTSRLSRTGRSPA
ncbi:lipid II flippase MurJ [Allobranchiibius sp. GilTou38]|uniref:murein biosynthesis integral membrane protein MurJ n=1 Tax=Allobranchiibius sp. GilTou38 TaxID=2815210 RepID=UPI001AA17D58|nr:lipid II flippase MurJ [Allobranchiibius sp. GilTou38]MBO1767392.1 polysaccharide biosynthesis C-terminal domain-containing protein [Allobranchiibius sp. GilTou38]